MVDSQPDTTKKAPDKAKRARKKPGKGVYILVGLAAFAFIMWAGLQRPQGSIKFGICKTLMETTVTYPIEFKVSSVEERPTNVRMEFTTINEYGEYILTTTSCTFRADPVTTWALTEVQMNRQKLPQSKIDEFNTMIPFILANPPDLTLPLPTSDNLLSLQR